MVIIAIERSSRGAIDDANKKQEKRIGTIPDIGVITFYTSFAAVRL